MASVLMSLRTTSGVIAVIKRAEGYLACRAGSSAAAHAGWRGRTWSILVFDNGNLRPGVTSPHSTGAGVRSGDQSAITLAVSRYLPPAFSRRIWVCGWRRTATPLPVIGVWPPGLKSPRRRNGMGIYHSVLNEYPEHPSVPSIYSPVPEQRSSVRISLCR